MDLTDAFLRATHSIASLLKRVAFVLYQCYGEDLAVCQWTVLQDLEQQVPVLYGLHVGDQIKRPAMPGQLW